jgi:hypothetical protein
MDTAKASMAMLKAIRKVAVRDIVPVNSNQ